MEEIAKLLYKSYIKEHMQEHYTRSEELEKAEKALLRSLTKEQFEKFNDYEMLSLDHVEERELRVIIYILMLMTFDEG